MDATTIAAPPEEAWLLLADLAACGQDMALCSHPQELAQAIVGQVRTHLGCAWCVVAMTLRDESTAVAGWGIDEPAQHALLAQTTSLPPHVLQVPLKNGTAGVVLFALAEPLAQSLRVSGFVGALGKQLELLVALCDRESARPQAAIELAAMLHADLVGQFDLHTMLQKVLSHMCRLAHAPAAAMFMLAEDGQLDLEAAHGFHNPPRHLRLAIGEDIAGQVLLRQTTLHVPGYPSFVHRSPHFAGEPWQVALGVPLRVQDQVVGVLVLFRDAQQPFSLGDQHLVETSTAPAALSIRNAQLFAQQQQRSRELFVLYENSQIIGATLHIESMLSHVAANIAVAMSADRCVLHLRDQNEPAVLYEAAAYSLEPSALSYSTRYNSRDYHLIAQLLQSSETLTLEETPQLSQAETAQVLRLLGFQSALLVALKNRDRTVGLLAVGFAQHNHHFSDAELNLAQTFASQVAAAIVNAQLFIVEQQRADELTKLQDMNTRLNNNLDLEETLHAIFNGVYALLPFAGMQICLYDTNEQVLRVMLHWHLQDDAPQTLTLSDGLSGWVARFRKPIRIDDDAQNAPAPPLVTHLYDGTPVPNYLGLPLLNGEQLVGTLELFNPPATRFSSMDEHLLQVAAGTAARALLNVQRYEQADEHLHNRLKQLTALQHISRQLATTLSLDVILAFALEEALRATPAGQGYIALRKGGEDDLKVEDAKTALLRGYIALRASAADQNFQIMAAAGYSTEQQEYLLSMALSDGDTLAEIALRSNEAELLDEVIDDDRLKGIGPAVASALAMPIFYEDHVVGVLNLHSSTAHAFNHDTIEFVRAMTDQVALAIGNAQRYDEQRRQRELLIKRAGMLNEVFSIGQALRADRSLEEVLEQIAFSVVDMANFRSLVFSLPATEQPDVFNIITGAGMPLSDVERLRQQPITLALLNRFFDKRFRLGRCFFVPAKIVHQYAKAAGLEPIYLFSAETATNNDDQLDDLLFVPLYSTRAQLVGAMIVSIPQDRPQPTLRSVEPLEIFGDQAAIAIENANLLLEARAQTEQMTALYHVGTAAVSTLDLDELLEGVFNEIVAYMGVPSFFFIASYESSKSLIHFELFKEGDRTFASRHKTTTPKGGWTGHVIDTGEPLYLRNATSDNADIPTKPITLGKRDVASWVGIPLRSQNEIIGVLSVQSDQPNAFRERDVQFLSALANQLAVALENARLFREREQRISQLNAINHLSRISNSTLDLEPMMHKIYDGIAASLPVDSGFIQIYSVGQTVINFGLQVDGDSRSYTEDTDGPSAGGMTDTILRSGKPLLLRDLREEHAREELKPLPFGNTQRRSASWLGVPLIGRDGETLGVLAIQSYTPNMYGERERAFLTTIASQVALGVQNASLFDSTRRKVGELSALLESSQVLSSTLRPSEVLDMLMDVVRRQFAVDSAALWTIGGDDVLVPIAMLGISSDEMSQLRVINNTGLIGRVAASGEPLVVSDVYHENTSLYPSFNEAHALQSFMGVPVNYRERTVGVLSVMSSQRRMFTTDEVTLLAGIASQSAIALENARLFEERERRLREMVVMQDIGSAVTSTLDLTEALERLHAELAHVIDVSTSYIGIYDPANGQIDFPLAYDQGTRLSIPLVPLEQNGLGRWVIDQRQPLLIGTHDEALAILSDLGPQYGDATQHEQSYVIVPIMSNDHVLGLINIQSYQQHAFSQDDLRFVSTVASQASQAIVNAQLYDEVRNANEELEERVQERTMQLSEEKESLQAVHEITLQLTASLDLNEILEKTLALASRVVGAWRGSIMLHSTPNDTLICQAVLGTDGVVQITDIPIAFAHGQSLANWVMNHHKAVRIDDVRRDGRWRHEEGRAEDVRSVVAVPLVAQDEPLGVLILSSPERAYFNDSQVNLLMTIAGEIAIVINNAKLHSFITDIASSRAELLNQQREENTKNQAILQSLGEGVIVLNEHAQIVLFNRAASEMLGMSEARVLGQPMEAIGRYGETAEIKQRSAKLLDGFKQGLQEVIHHTKNHTRVIELDEPNQVIALNFAAVVGAGSAIYGSVVVLRDITREIESDRAKRDFVSSVSHELRTPLTSIKGYVDLLSYGTAGPINENQGAFLSVVKNNTKRLMDLIDDMLEIGRIDSSKIELNFEDIDMTDVVQDVLQTLQAEINRKEQLVDLELALSLPTVEADKRRITQVVLNLVSNAVKYTYPRGTIMVRTSLNPAGMLEVNVQDTGVGISPDQQKNLFRRFYRADNPLRDQVAGTGLGLSIAKSLVELHGGEMWVESEIGQGSTFSFIVPVQQAERD